MWQSERGYLINSTTWSSYLSVLIFVGLALALSLPTSTQILTLADRGGNTLSLLYPFVAILLYGILAMNFGQLEQDWVSQFGRAWPQYYRHLVTQLGFLLLMLLPTWIVYQGANHLPAVRLLWGGAHLFLYGLTAGLFGMLVGLRAQSEITQFNIKYAVFIAFVLLTGISFQPLNPFLVLFAIFGDAVLHQSIGFFLLSYLGFGVLIAVLFWLTRRQILRIEEAHL